MKTYLIIAAFVLPACGGTSFTTGFEGPDGGTELEAAPSTGGETDSGDATADAGDTGGETSSTGGATGMGGTRETGGVTSTGGTTSAGGTTTTATGGTAACTPVTHNNGTGQTWKDCIPLGTHDQDQAMKACAAFVGLDGACTAFPAPACGTEPEVTGVTSTGHAVWQYTGEEDGYVSTSGGCPAPTARTHWD